MTDPFVNASSPVTERFSRIERKFPVARSREEVVAAWLGHACRPPAQFAAGQISSCYFDSPDLASYFESVDGDAAKRKVRVRWYGALPASGSAPAYVEVKSRDGMRTSKRRVEISLDVAAVRAGAWDRALPRGDLTSALARLGVFDGDWLRPVAIVSYWRRRFVEPASGHQIALDSGLLTWAAGDSAVHGVAMGTPVLELKGPEFDLPFRLAALKRWVTVWAANSKYALAIEKLGPAALAGFAIR